MSYELRGWVLKWGHLTGPLGPGWGCESAVMMPGACVVSSRVAVYRTHGGNGPEWVQVPGQRGSEWAQRTAARTVLARPEHYPEHLRPADVYVAAEGVFVRLALPAVAMAGDAPAGAREYELWRAVRDVRAGIYRAWSGEFDLSAAARYGAGASQHVFTAGASLVGVALVEVGANRGAAVWLADASDPGLPARVAFVPAAAGAVRTAAASAVVRLGEVG